MLIPEDLSPIGVMVGDLGPVVLQVNVTAHHIARGREGDCALCPIALAIRDAARTAGLALDKGPSVKVCSDWVTVWRQDGQRFGGELVEEAERFIVRFDGTPPGTPRPFRFSLRLGAL